MYLIKTDLRIDDALLLNLIQKGRYSDLPLQFYFKYFYRENDYHFYIWG
ncbi:hypothetical protein MTBBW1_180026 [Desulfamplus magnetovallimortis]|uniref:Uncharacterized protein n=1 Tax=Desulfamplus magnetovallimortis TaxID=1246637 RepID=A0A1W1HAJ2_9BACT|nr:hypothetical protein MTBBW1_180026 [Desulfamplus magnetovallimortis]